MALDKEEASLVPCLEIAAFHLVHAQCLFWYHYPVRRKSHSCCLSLPFLVQHETVLHRMERDMNGFIGLSNLKEQFMRFDPREAFMYLATSTFSAPLSDRTREGSPYFLVASIK